MLTCTKEQIFKLYECEPHFTMMIASSNEEAIVVRNYKGIIETFGEIGGNKQILDFIFMILHAFLMYYALKRFYVREIFGIGIKTS